MRMLSSGLLLALSLSGVAAQAEVRQMPWEASPSPHLVEDKVRVEVGVWNTSVNTTIRADTTATQAGTTLDGESDLGMAESRVMPDIELSLFPGKRQLIRVNGFSSHRSGSAVLTKPIQFDGNTYQTGDVVKSVLNLDMLGVGYAYRLLKAPRYELDIGVDVQIASTKVNAFVPRRGVREADDGVLPIPLLDVEGRWEFYRKWQLVARYRWLGGSGQDASGTYLDWRVGVQWQFSQHLGVGLHYRSFGLQVDSSSTSNPGQLRLDHKGAELGFRASL